MFVICLTEAAVCIAIVNPYSVNHLAMPQSRNVGAAGQYRDLAVLSTEQVFYQYEKLMVTYFLVVHADSGHEMKNKCKISYQ